jgi:hypothetical protein
VIVQCTFSVLFTGIRGDFLAVGTGGPLLLHGLWCLLAPVPLVHSITLASVFDGANTWQPMLRASAATADAWTCSYPSSRRLVLASPAAPEQYERRSMSGTLPFANVSIAVELSPTATVQDVASVSQAILAAFGNASTTAPQLNATLSAIAAAAAVEGMAMAPVVATFSDVVVTTSSATDVGGASSAGPSQGPSTVTVVASAVVSAICLIVGATVLLVLWRRRQTRRASTVAVAADDDEHGNAAASALVGAPTSQPDKTDNAASLIVLPQLPRPASELLPGQASSGSVVSLSKLTSTAHRFVVALNGDTGAGALSLAAEWPSPRVAPPAQPIGGSRLASLGLRGGNGSGSRSRSACEGADGEIRRQPSAKVVATPPSASERGMQLVQLRPQVRDTEAVTDAAPWYVDNPMSATRSADPAGPARDVRAQRGR